MSLNYTPGGVVTCIVKQPVTEGRFVMIADDIQGRNPVIKPATADSHPFGLAAWSEKADKPVTVYRTGIHTVEATGTITAGDAISVGADGKAAKTTAGPVVGIAVDKAAGNRVTIALI